MSQTNFKPAFQTKVLFMAIVIGFYFVSDSFGRKVYSIGNNSAWSSVATWSLSVNGPMAGLVPQNNDTVVINNTVIQNVDFSFSEAGMLEISVNGLLRGDNQKLSFAGNSTLKCNGELKINILNLNDRSSLLVEPNGKITVKNSLVTNSSSNQTVSGKILVTGTLSVSSSAIINGNGTIVSAHYDGNGSVLSFNNASLIPDGSLVTEYNWVGNQDNNWNNPKNWAGKIVPGNTSNIAVVSSLNDPEMAGNAKTKIGRAHV